MKTLSYLYLVRTQYIIFDTVEYQLRYRKNPFALGDTYLTPFVNFCSSFLYNTRKNNTRKCDTEGFLPVEYLNGVVRSMSLFNSYMYA